MRSSAILIPAWRLLSANHLILADSALSFRTRCALCRFDWAHGFVGRVVSGNHSVNPHETARAAGHHDRVSGACLRNDARGRAAVESLLGWRINLSPELASPSGQEI